MKSNVRLVELCDRIRSDPSNAGYLMLLAFYPNDEIERAIDELDDLAKGGDTED